MIAAFLLALCPGQPCSDEPPAPPAVVQPRWAVRPQLDPPARLSRSGLEAASATITCRANPDGSVDDCLVAAENPPGAGLGPALVRAARDARVDPASLPAEGGSRVTFTAQFRLD